MSPSSSRPWTEYPACQAGSMASTPFSNHLRVSSARFVCAFRSACVLWVAPPGFCPSHSGRTPQIEGEPILEKVKLCVGDIPQPAGGRAKTASSSPWWALCSPWWAGVARILEGAPLGFRLRRVPRVEPGAVEPGAAATELTDHVTDEGHRRGDARGVEAVEHRAAPVRGHRCA